MQPVDSKILQENIPAIYRDPDNRWFALTTRVRAIYSSKDRLGKLDSISYEDLAKPEFKGKSALAAASMSTMWRWSPP